MFGEIAAAFDLRGRRVIFAFGDTIYNPDRIEITPALAAHERVHGERQLAMGVERWWRSYIDDRAFRRDEEILAHQVEYLTHCQRALSRNERRFYENAIAEKLASPLYGVMRVDQARKFMKEAAKTVRRAAAA